MKNDLTPFFNNPKQDIFIEASAGTGKTYTIQKIVAKLVETGVELNKILIVTYTEKAAGELRNRIRAELAERVTCKQSSVKTRELFQTALREVDTATIGTIHSFCQKTLRDYAFEAGQLFSVEMVNDAAVGDFIDREIRDELVNEEEFVELVKNGDDVKSIIKELKSLFISGVGNYFEGVNVSSHPLAWVNNYQDLCEIEGFNDEVAKLKNNTAWKKRDAFIEALKQWDGEGELFSGTSFNKRGWEESQTYFVALKKNLLKRKGTPLHDFALKHLAAVVAEWKQYKVEQGFQSYNDMIDSVREKVKDDDFCQTLRNRFTYAIIDEFQDTNQRQWDIFKKLFLESNDHHLIVVGDPKQSIYSFQGADVDVYKQATKEILNKGGNGYRLDTNYRSTNDMIEACNVLFKNLKGNANNDPALGDNFATSNAPSESTLQKLAPLFDGNAIKPFQISEFCSAEDFARLVVACIRQYVEKGADGKTRLQVFDKNHPGECRDVTLRDFAILARTRSEMDPIEDEMRREGIPFLRYKDKNLFAGRECREWIALYKALNVADFTGDNLRFLNEALVTDFFGVPVQLVSSTKYQRGDCEERILLQEWKSKLDQHLYAQFLEDVFARSQLNKQLGTIYRLQEFAKTKQIGDYAVRYLIDHQTSLANLIQHLESLSQDESQAEDENGNLIAKSTDFDAVQIMTIHASKGLEFPVVISVGGFKGENNKAYSNSFFLYHDDDKDLKLGVDDSAKNKRKAEEMTEWQRLFYVAYTRASSLMLLPRYIEWRKKPAKGKQTGEIKEEFKFLANAFNESNEEDKGVKKNLQGHYDPLEIAEEKRGKVSCVDRCEVDVSVDIPCVQKQMPTAVQWMHSYSSLAHGDEEESTATSADGRSLQGSNGPEEVTVVGVGIDPNPIILQNEYDKHPNDVPNAINYPAGAALGNVLHNVLEAICKGEQRLSFAAFGMQGVGEMKGCASLRNLLRREFAEQGFHGESRLEDWIDHSIDLLWNTLNARLKTAKGEDGFRLADLAPETMRAELEYYLNADGLDYRAFCKGFMDLVFKHQGRYCILDWKSDRLESYEADAVKTCIDERYSIQRVLYPYCLIQWLKTFHSEMSESEIFENCFGGIYYVLLRGTKIETANGIYAQTWSSYEALKASYDVISQKIETLAKR